jgi:hypothetical protein
MSRAINVIFYSIADQRRMTSVTAKERTREQREATVRAVNLLTFYIHMMMIISTDYLEV